MDDLDTTPLPQGERTSDVKLPPLPRWDGFGDPQLPPMPRLEEAPDEDAAQSSPRSNLIVDQAMGRNRLPHSNRCMKAMGAPSYTKHWTILIDLGNGIKIGMHPTAIWQANDTGACFHVRGYLTSANGTGFVGGSYVWLYIDDRSRSGSIQIERTPAK